MVGDEEGKLKTGRGGVGVFLGCSCCESIICGVATGWRRGKVATNIKFDDCRLKFETSTCGLHPILADGKLGSA